MRNIRRAGTPSLPDTLLARILKMMSTAMTRKIYSMEGCICCCLRRSGSGYSTYNFTQTGAAQIASCALLGKDYRKTHGSTTG
jgi:hypothetical protein